MSEIPEKCLWSRAELENTTSFWFDGLKTLLRNLQSSGHQLVMTRKSFLYCIEFLLFLLNSWISEFTGKLQMWKSDVNCTLTSSVNLPVISGAIHRNDWDAIWGLQLESSLYSCTYRTLVAHRWNRLAGSFSAMHRSSPKLSRRKKLSPEQWVQSLVSAFSAFLLSVFFPRISRFLTIGEESTEKSACEKSVQFTSDDGGVQQGDTRSRVEGQVARITSCSPGHLDVNTRLYRR